MAILYYPAIIEQADGNLSVFFPDLDGLASAGDTIEEAACHAEEALALHLKWMRQAGDDIPAPTPIETIPPLDEGEEICRILVKAFIPGNASRIDILVEDDLLQQIDDAAKRAGTDRSGFLAEAARKALHVT